MKTTEKVGRFIKSIPIQYWYVLLVVLVVLWYIPARDVMISQDAWVRVVKSKLTFNFVLSLGLLGYLADKGKLAKTKKRNNLMWVLGTAGLITLQMLADWGSPD